MLYARINFIWSDQSLFWLVRIRIIHLWNTILLFILVFYTLTIFCFAFCDTLWSWISESGELKKYEIKTKKNTANRWHIFYTTSAVFVSILLPVEQVYDFRFRWVRKIIIQKENTVHIYMIFYDEFVTIVFLIPRIFV